MKTGNQRRWAERHARERMRREAERLVNASSQIVPPPIPEEMSEPRAPSRLRAVCHRWHNERPRDVGYPDLCPECASRLKGG